MVMLTRHPPPPPGVPRSAIIRNLAISDWEPWFAWYPVTSISGNRKWLTRINRRLVTIPRFSSTYQYGDVFDILRE